MPPMKFSSAEKLKTKIDEYFRMCDEKGDPYTITGLALALDTTRETLMDVENGNGPYTPAHSDAVKKAKLRVENYAEKALFSRQNPAGPIFALKNFGWRDSQDIELSGELHTTGLSEDELEERILSIVSSRSSRQNRQGAPMH